MILSQSQIAAKGYYIPQADTTVYSVEELAYMCMHKGYTLDGDFACAELVRFIQEDCGCEELGYRLENILSEKGDKNAFVEAILRFVGYVSEGEIGRIIRDISEGLNLSGLERKKLNADMLYRHGEYMPAIRAYESLLHLIPSAEISMRAACYYNLAAARAQLFLFEEALDALEASYRLEKSESTLLAWLAVSRLHYPEKQYLEIVAGREDLYNLSLQLEEKMKETEAGIITTGTGQELEKLREWMQYGGEEGYYVAAGRVLKSLCEEYKNCY